MYKNIVFDLGGVVVDYEPHEFLVDHFMNEKLEQKLYDITFGSAEWLKLDAGAITRQEAEIIMREKGAQIGRKFEMDMLLTDWLDMLKTKDDTVNLMRKLKRNGYRIFYLSNIAADTLEHLSKRNFWGLFDGGVASCDVRMLKPDHRIFERLLRKFSLDPQETIFIDDSPANIVAVSDMGMAGLRFKHTRELVRALESYGVNTKLNKKRALQ